MHYSLFIFKKQIFWFHLDVLCLMGMVNLSINMFVTLKHVLVWIRLIFSHLTHSRLKNQSGHIQHLEIIFQTMQKLITKQIKIYTNIFEKKNNEFLQDRKKSLFFLLTKFISFSIIKLRLHVEIFSCACNAICFIAAPEKILSWSHENILFYATKISKILLHAMCNKIDPDLFYYTLHAIFSLSNMTPSLSCQILQHFYRYISVKPIKIVYLYILFFECKQTKK